MKPPGARVVPAGKVYVMPCENERPSSVSVTEPMLVSSRNSYVWGETAAEIFLDGEFQMRGHLCFQLAVELGAPEQRAQAGKGSSELAHHE